MKTTVVRLHDGRVYEGRLVSIRNGMVTLAPANAQSSQDWVYLRFDEVETITNYLEFGDRVMGNVTIVQTAGGDIVKGNKYG